MIYTVLTGSFESGTSLSRPRAGKAQIMSALLRRMGYDVAYAEGTVGALESAEKPSEADWGLAWSLVPDSWNPDRIGYKVDTYRVLRHEAVITRGWGEAHPEGKANPFGTEYLVRVDGEDHMGFDLPRSRYAHADAFYEAYVEKVGSILDGIYLDHIEEVALPERAGLPIPLHVAG